MKKHQKLRAYYNKKEACHPRDIMLEYPLGIQTKMDSAFLNCQVFTRENLKELEDRGYDISTLRFEVGINFNHPNAADKFPSLYAEYNMQNKKPETGKTYLCILEHFSSKNRQEHLLVKVDEDDCDWRTADDNSEVAYEWNVVGWREQK